MATPQLMYPHARKYLAGHLWALREDTLSMMCELLRLRANGIVLSDQEIQARIGAARRVAPAMQGSVAVIPLNGVIDQKVGSMADISGGTAVNAFMDCVRQALGDKSVSAIVLDVDSPGGSVSGIPEAADELYRSRGKKPIVAVADPMIASAAYWLACAADEVVCMPSGQVGSVGVIAVHDDYSEQNQMLGYKPTYVTYGQFKAEGNADEPMSDEARAYLQTQVNAMGDMFTRFVAKARGLAVDTVRNDFGQGRMLLAKDALSVKMIDSIGTLDQTIARVAKGGTTVKTSAETAAITLEARVHGSAPESIDVAASEAAGVRDDTAGLSSALLDDIEAALAIASRM